MTSFSLFGCFRRHFKGATGEAPKDIQDVFAKYATNGKLDASKLLLFLREVQGEPNATLEQAQDLVNRQLGLIGSRVRHGELNLDDFLKLLLDPTLNNPLEKNVILLLLSILRPCVVFRSQVERSSVFVVLLIFNMLSKNVMVV